MADLEQSIAGWRQQMLAAGIQSPVPLEELESHLREEIEQQMKSGLDPQPAFDAATGQIGHAEVLKMEFRKVSIPMQERLKQSFFALAGIRNHQFTTNMNAANPNLEPRWATYLKSAVWTFPALFIWISCDVLVVPKFKQVCAAYNPKLPGLIMYQLAVADVVRNHFFIGTLVFLAVLLLAEWRWRGWSRYRRPLFGIAGFCLNFFALSFLASLLVFAVLVASNLAQPH